MPLGFATLPLAPDQLRALADSDYTIVDQAQRTPGLLIVQAPDQASGERRQASEPDPLPQPPADAAAASLDEGSP